MQKISAHFTRSFLIRLFFALLMAFFLFGLSGAGSSQVQARKVKITSLKKKKKRINWHSYLPLRYRFKYRVMQGSATDGKYNYFAFWHKNHEDCVILKVNARTHKKVKVSRPLLIHHGNDLTYNPVTGLLYVVYSDINPLEVSIVNPKTLKVCGTKTVVIPPVLPGATPEMSAFFPGIVGITYNKSKRLYAMRVSGLNDFIICNEDFVALRYVKVNKTFNLRRQSMDSDNNTVYVCMDNSGSYNVLIAYSWTGRYKYGVKIPLSYEMEEVFHRGRRFYATFYNKKGPSSYTYWMDLP